MTFFSPVSVYENVGGAVYFSVVPERGVL